MPFSDNAIKLVDIGVKGIVGAAIAGGVAYYGSMLEDERAKAQEANRRLQATVELTSRQKELDVDLGMRLFGALMSYYFEKDKAARQPEAVRQQMLLLRLVALNFLDVPIQLKPLFEDLDRQLIRPEDRQRLRGIAQEVARRQAYRLTIEDGGYDSGPREMKPGGELSIPQLLTTVAIEAVNADGVRATIRSTPVGDRPIGPFFVTYFDMPLVDNTAVGEHRVALLVHSSGPDRAEVRFVAFPRHLAADRFDIKQLSRSFRDEKTD